MARIFLSVILGYTTLTSAFASSIFSAATGAVARQFHVSTEVGILGVSLYVLGFACGPILWAPLSELKGRKLPLIIAMLGFSIFSVGSAVGKDLQTVLICRFFGGAFGSCPLAVVAAIFSDMFDNRTRGLAVTVFSMTVFTGPLLAPFIGGFTVMNKNLGWRWTEYIAALMGFLALGLNVLFLEETYPPIVLVEKASELRRRTLNWGIHAKQEEIEVDFRELVTKNFSRPLRLLVTEPIVLLRKSFFCQYFCMIGAGFVSRLISNPRKDVLTRKLSSQHLHGFHLRPALPVPHRLSHRLPGHPPHESRRWRTPLLWYGLRHDPRRSIHCLHPEILRSKVGRERQRHDSGMASPTGHRRWHIFHPGSLLVRVVRLQSRHPLDRTDAIRPPHRIRLALHLPPIAQLPRGFLSHVVSRPIPAPLPPHPSIQPRLTPPLLSQRRLSHRGKHLPALPLRRRLPPLRHIHVQRPRRQLGRHPPRLRRPRPRPHPRRLLAVRREDQDEE